MPFGVIIVVCISYDELNKMIADGKMAFDYAWNNYDMLNNRSAAYKLYGSYAPYGIGAVSPSTLVRKTDRVLKKSTKRKQYTLYEFNEDFQIIRTSHIKKNGEIDCTQLHFELNDIQYAVPFAKGEKRFYISDVCATKFREGKPEYFAEIHKTSLTAEFYEYIVDDLVTVTCYSYYPKAKISAFGEPISYDVPYGTPKSPIVLSCFESPIPCMDFSKLFMDE